MRRTPWFRPTLIGLALGLAFFVLFNVLVGPIMHSVFRGPPTPTAVLTLLREPTNFPFWLTTALLAGYGEELIRIFALTRFERAWARSGVMIALGVDSVVFGLTHRYQGVAGMITTGLSGLAWGLIFLRRRSATEVMVSHAFFDTISILLAFAMAPHH